MYLYYPKLGVFFKIFFSHNKNNTLHPILSNYNEFFRLSETCLKYGAIEKIEIYTKEIDK